MVVDKLLKKLGIKKLDQNDLLLYGGIAAVSWILATNFFKKGHPLSFYSSYDTSSSNTTTAAPTIQDLKDKILQNIIRRAEDVNVVITNLETIKTEIEGYNAKLELLVGEIAGDRLPTSIIQQYLQNIIKEIASKLEIRLRLPMAGQGGGGYGYGWGGYRPPWADGGLGGWADENPYSQYYQDYIQRLQDYYSQYMNQFSYYSPESFYYTPSYYFPQTNPYYSYQQTYNPQQQMYNQQPYSYSYPNYGGYSGYPQSYGQGGYGNQGGYGQYPYY